MTDPIPEPGAGQAGVRMWTLLRRHEVAITAVAIVAALVGLGVVWASGGDDDAAPPSTPNGTDSSATPTVGERPDPTGTTPDDVGILGPEVTDATGRYAWQARIMGAGGWVTGIIAHPNDPDVIMARSDNGGAFVWDEDARRWEQMLLASHVEDAGPSDFGVESLAQAPSDSSRVYVAVGGARREAGRVLRSDDGGATWQRPSHVFEIDGNNPNRMGGERVAVDPVDPDTVWFGNRFEGLWRSTDAGESWQLEEQLGDGDEPAEISWVVAADDGVIYYGVVGVGVRTGRAGGPYVEVWSSDANPLDAEFDAIGRLWVVESDNQTVRRLDPSTGEVDKWSLDGSTSGIGVDPNDPTRAVVVGTGDFWTTTDDGDQWRHRDFTMTCDSVPWIEEVFTGFLSASSPTIDPFHATRLWWPMGVGVMVDDSSGLWGDEPLQLHCEPEGIEQLVTNDIVVPVSDAPVSAHWDRALFRHVPGAVTFPQLGPTYRFNAAWDIDVYAGDPARMVAVVADPRGCCYDDESFRSVFTTDGGVTWEPFASYKDGNHPDDLRFGNIAVASNDPDNIAWLPTYDKALHYTTDGGASWTPVVLPGTEGMVDANGNPNGGSHFQKYLRRSVLTADQVEPDTFYLLHSVLGVMRSTDGAATWELVSGPEPFRMGVSFYSARMAAHPTDAGRLYYTPGTVEGSTEPFNQSTDGGETWTEVPRFTEVAAVGWGASLEPGGPVAMYVSGRYDDVTGLYRSGDDGVTWEQIAVAPGDLANRVQAVAGDPGIPGRVYVGFNGSSIMQGDDPQLVAD